jgi:hypothetical protein
MKNSIWHYYKPKWIDIGALDAMEKPAEGVLSYSIVVAWRESKIDTVCWAGNVVNEGVTANPSKMEWLQSVAR